MNVRTRSAPFLEFLTVKKDCTKGISLKFNINFYHTTSNILVNGNKVEIFERDLFERICEGIRKLGAKLTIVNEQISMALSDIERKLSASNMGTRSKVTSITEGNGNDCNSLKIDTENVNENSDADIGSVAISMTQSDNLALSQEDLCERIYQCPICDQTAWDDTIAVKSAVSGFTLPVRE